MVWSGRFRTGSFPNLPCGWAKEKSDPAGISSLVGAARGSMEQKKGTVWGFSGFLGDFTPSFLKDGDVGVGRRHSVKKFLFRGVGQTFAIEGLYGEILKVSGPRGGASFGGNCGGEGG